LNEVLSPRRGAQSDTATRVPISKSRSYVDFWVVMALVMIALMAISFAPSFYSRPFLSGNALSGATDIPPHLVVHGAVLTSWFLLFLAQTLLVTSSRTDLHRRVGHFGAALALAVIFTSVITSINAIPRFNARGVDPNLIALVVTGDFLALTQFAILLGCGVLFRTRPAAHKRLMLFASLAVIGPGLFGGGRPLTLLQPFVPFPLALLFMVVTVGLVIAYDFVSLRRVHPATIWGGAVGNIVMIALFGASLATGVGRSVVTWLSGR
jgi:hypothetical protein